MEGHGRSIDATGVLVLAKSTTPKRKHSRSGERKQGAGRRGRGVDDENECARAVD